jgi:hypothetical protein
LNVGLSKAQDDPQSRGSPNRNEWAYAKVTIPWAQNTAVCADPAAPIVGHGITVLAASGSSAVVAGPVSPPAGGHRDPGDAPLHAVTPAPTQS